MSGIKNWCASKDEDVKIHHLRVLEVDPAKITTAIEEIPKVVPGHYASAERVARLMQRLGKPAAAKFIEDKLPTSKSIRSGDLGEILGSSYVTEFTDFTTGINRLRWKDHREMAMRGDDIIAVRIVSSPEKINFLKGEVKSNVSLSPSTVTKARKALLNNKSRPSAHALTFLADRLHDKGQNDLADLIDDAQLVLGIKLKQVSHLMFTFSANDPTSILRNDLNAYTGTVAQYAVGLRVKTHQTFIKSVFEKVIADGGKH